MPPMGAREWMGLLAALGHLALAVLSVVRGRQSVVARPLALLCFALFGWNFATLAERASGAPAWGIVDSILTALSPPLMLRLVATFVGGRRAHGPLVTASFVFFGGLALSSSSAFFGPLGHRWIESRAWAEIFLVAWAPTLALSLLWLVRHLSTSRQSEEKARTRMFLAAFALGGALATTDELAELGWPIPHLASVGTLAGTFLVATAVFRFRLLDRDLSVSTGVYAAVLASVGVVAYAVVLRSFGGSVAAVGLATILVTLALVAAARELTASRAAQRARVEQLTVLGRLSAQMAHDIKNPLAALLGAAHLLEEGAEQPPGERRGEFLRLVVDQAERIRAIVDKYERIGRVDPVTTRVKMNDVVRRVMAAQSVAAKDVAIALDLFDRLPECDADADLVASALENVVRNAVEAMPLGGALRVGTRVEEPAAGDAAVVVHVEDTGEGMDARRAERAFDDFYTTKATGSGLGLAFVRRVALAHGGSVSLTSRPGEGTRVELRLPALRAS
jgi:two-component system sensor histidine kinase HydH